MMALRAKVHVTRAAHGRVVLADGPSPAPASAPDPVLGSAGDPGRPRVPRVARLMALAIRFDRLLREGRVKSLTELARLARVTQPRVTQILNLTLLAPDIQESILTLQACRSGREQVHERLLRPIAAMVDWREQRRGWAALRHQE